MDKNKKGIIEESIDNNLKMIEQLANDVNTNVNVQDDYGNTALHYCAVVGNVDAVKILVKKGANPFIMNYNYLTPGLLSFGDNSVTRYFMEEMYKDLWIQ